MASAVAAAGVRNGAASGAGKGHRIYVLRDEGSAHKMNKTIFPIALLGALALQSPALAQKSGPEPTIDGVARSASLMATIGEACPLLMDVNTALAERYAQAFVAAGEQAVGKPAFARKLAAERARRATEVKAKTPESWCLDQRARLEQMGGADLFRK